MRDPKMVRLLELLSDIVEGQLPEGVGYMLALVRSGEGGGLGFLEVARDSTDEDVHTVIEALRQTLSVGSKPKANRLVVTSEVEELKCGPKPGSN